MSPPKRGPTPAGQDLLGAMAHDWMIPVFGDTGQMHPTHRISDALLLPSSNGLGYQLTVVNGCHRSDIDSILISPIDTHSNMIHHMSIARMINTVRCIDGCKFAREERTMMPFHDSFLSCDSADGGDVIHPYCGWRLIAHHDVF